jgi:hypothetical protein
MKKLGIWLPSRKTHIRVDYNQPGYFITSFRNELVKKLGRIKGIKIKDNLDFRDAYVHNSEVFAGDFCLNDLDVFYWFGEIGRS